MTTLTNDQSTEAEGAQRSQRSWATRVWSGAAAAIAAVMVIATVSVASSHHEVTLEVDGVSRPVSLFGSTVGDVLDHAEVDLGSHDQVVPSRDSILVDGQHITVTTALPYDVMVDGQRITIWSTARNSADILADIAHRGDSITVAASRSNERSPLATLTDRDAIARVVVDGADRTVEVPTGATVTEVLSAAKINVSPIDRVRVSRDKGRLLITIQRVTRGYTTTTTDIPFETVTTDDDTVLEGKTEVETEGVPGVHRKVVYEEKVDGKATVHHVVSDEVVREPVTEVIRNGTKPKPVHSRPSRDDVPSIADPDMPGTTPAGAQAIARNLVAERGWDDGEFSCLVTLWNRESGWNYRSYNSGSGAYGIPQSLPGSKMASAGSDWRTNPTTQMIWGLGYISGRYGTPCNALDHSYSRGWY